MQIAEMKKKPKMLKTKCPCCSTSGGKSWLLNCSHCGQVWHSSCANLKGKDLTQKGIDSLLPQWECPWCYVCPYAPPKSQKSLKLTSSLRETSQANQISSAVIDALEGMVDSKLSQLKTGDCDFIEGIQKQLEDLTKNVALLQSAPKSPPHDYQSPPDVKPPEIKTSNINLEHTTKHIDGMVESFITESEEKELMDFLEQETFVSEGKRSVIQYGEYYRYMGSKTKPREMPEKIKNLMDRLNNDYASSHREPRYHYQLNSCLVNRYGNDNDTLPEHADDEGDINALSSIFTVSLGSPRNIWFRDVQSDKRISVLCKGRSMYHMSRHSQDFFKHGIKKQDDPSLGVRYSLTFRAIHWSNFNSTALIGDSNFGPINFGEGKGKLGQSTPGVRIWSPTIEKIDPLSCTSFKNVVLMVGTNDLKMENVTDEQIHSLYKNYKTKVSLIRKYNSRCRIYICPVLPTKSHDMNRRIGLFNRLIFNDLLQSSLNVIVVEGFLKFLDKSSNLLSADFSRYDRSDMLHLNGKGISVLVGLIKNCIFTTRSRNKINSGKLYASAVRNGPNPV